ncbi:hypothetical protein LR007_04625 [candidate division NPL-UPA2 bacterium]|nr:hypothetical protein [candidate division NPL-UPA2 bacterium]
MARAIYQRPYLRELIYQAGDEEEILNKEKKLEIDEKRFLGEAKELFSDPSFILPCGAVFLDMEKKQRKRKRRRKQD